MEPSDTEKDAEATSMMFDVEAAEEAARARMWQARAAFLPSVSASASYTRLDEIPYMDGSQFGNMFGPLIAPFQELYDQGLISDDAGWLASAPEGVDLPSAPLDLAEPTRSEESTLTMEYGGMP